MKRFAALMTALILLLSAPALAFTGQGYPEWDGATIPDSGFCGALDGERILLSFDPSDEYSSVEDGLVQACFFAYDSTERNFMEIYLLLPQDVAPGDVLASGQDLDCSVYLYETVDGNETFYYAGDLGTNLTSSSSFEINIESVEKTESAISMRGQLTAQLTRYDREIIGQEELLTIGEAHFSFSMPLGGSAFAPAPSQTPGDAFPGIDTPDQPRTGFGGSNLVPPPDAVAI